MQPTAEVTEVSSVIEVNKIWIWILGFLKRNNKTGDMDSSTLFSEVSCFAIDLENEGMI